MAEPRIPVRMNHLCCPVCNKVLRDPATIPCGHNFCMRCIQEHWDHHERSDSSCSCPECGCVFPSKPQLIKNTTLADLVRETERCDAGSERSRRQAQKRSWSGTETGTPLCWRHNSPLDVYCCTDEQIICAVCASAEHTGHTIGSVKGERKRKQDELREMQKKSKQILQQQEKKWNKLGETLEEMQEEARNTEDYCESILVEVIDALQRHFLSVKAMIAALGEAAAAQVQSFMQTLQVKMEKTRRRSDELELLAQTDNDVHFLERWPPLRHLCEKDCRHALHGVSKDPLLPLELTKRAVEELGRQLEEFCDKEFTSICQATKGGEQHESGGETEEDETEQRCDAGTSQDHGLLVFNNTVTEQAVVPETRADFLQLPSDPEPVSRGEGQVNISTRSSQRQRPGVQSSGKKSPASWTNRNPDVMDIRRSRRVLRGNPPATEPDSQSDSSSEEDTASCLKQQEERASGAASPEAGRLLRRPRRHPTWSQDYQMFQ